MIDKSCAVQIATGGRQINEYRFDLDKPNISLDRVFDGNPAAQRAFEKLVDCPGSWFAYCDFRRTLREGPCFSGEIKSEKLSKSNVTRIPLRPGSGGVIVRNSKGVQIGLNNRQSNVFNYKFVRAEMSAETALRNSRPLARCLAVAVRNPDFKAAQRSLDRHLEQVRARLSGHVDQKSVSYANLSEVNVTGHGIQIGTDNSRVDKVFIRIEELKAKGLESVWGPGRRSAGGMEREERLSQRHMSAIAAARPPGLQVPSAGQPRACSLGKVIGEASKMALNHAAPGRSYLAGQTAENMETALDSPRPLDRGGIRELKGLNRYLVPGGGFRLSPRGEPSPGRVSLSPGLPSAEDRGLRRTMGLPPGHPEVKLVALSPLDRRPDQGDLGVREDREYHAPPEHPRLSAAQSGSGTAASQTDTTSHARKPEPDEGEGDTRALNRAAGGSAGGSAVHAMAAVVWGSAAEIAAAEGTRFLDGGVLLSYVRRRLWHDRGDKTPRSVKPVLRALRKLQVIIFLDPSIGGGLWVDVDEQRQVPAATSLISMDLSAGPPLRFTVFTQAR